MAITDLGPNGTGANDLQKRSQVEALVAAGSGGGFLSTFADVARTSEWAPAVQEFVTVPLGVESVDKGGNYDPNVGAYMYTVPADGVYLAIARLRPRDGVADQLNYGVGVHTSNVDGAFFQWIATTTSNGQRHGADYQRIAEWKAGDKLRLYVYLQSGFAFQYMQLTIIRIA